MIGMYSTLIWCAEKFRMAFEVPPEKCVVIKNAIEKFADKPIHKNGDKIKLIYTSTPLERIICVIRCYAAN
jgi:hypothetical protein